MKAASLVVLALPTVVLVQGLAAQAMPASPEAHQVFRAPLITGLGTPARDIAFADLDGDGKTDVAVARPSALEVRLGLGGGAFGAPVTVPSSGGLVAFELADLDGDTTPDLVGVAASNGGFVRVALGDGSGGFAAPTDIAIDADAFFESVAVTVGDADADADLDVAVTVPQDALFGTDAYIALYVNDGAGGLTELPISTTHDVAPQLVPAELNGDGLPDVLLSAWPDVGTAATHVVMLGQPGGGFVEGQSFGTDFILDHVADLDQDGDADLLLGKIGGLSVWLGQGDGSFQHLQELALGWTVLSIDTADFDGDAKLDVVAFRNILSDVLLLRGAGDGTLSIEAGVTMGPNAIFTMTGPRLVDLDGDGGLDLATGYGFEGPGTASPTLSAVRNVTYAAGGPLTDWGGARRGWNGYPVQIVTGTLAPSSPVLFELEVAKPSASAWMVIGFDAIFAPFKGGVLVPRPDLVIGPLPTGATGSVDIGGTWPTGLPPGATFDVHFWINDFTGLKGFAASGSAHLVQP